jgi:hypothetical protein
VSVAPVAKGISFGLKIAWPTKLGVNTRNEAAKKPAGAPPIRAAIFQVAQIAHNANNADNKCNTL